MKLFEESRETYEATEPEPTPMSRLADEVDRLRLIKREKRSRMHAGYFLYISSDDYVPYVGEGLGDNEILISNSMGEVEFYRYRLLEDGSVVAVGAKDGVEVLGAFNDSLATTHADFLTQFGQELVTSA